MPPPVGVALLVGISQHGYESWNCGYSTIYFQQHPGPAFPRLKAGLFIILDQKTQTL